MLVSRGIMVVVVNLKRFITSSTLFHPDFSLFPFPVLSPSSKKFCWRIRRDLLRLPNVFSPLLFPSVFLLWGRKLTQKGVGVIPSRICQNVFNQDCRLKTWKPPWNSNRWALFFILAPIFPFLVSQYLCRGIAAIICPESDRQERSSLTLLCHRSPQIFVPHRSTLYFTI